MPEITTPLAPLLSPLSLRSVTIRNRVAMSPMTRNFSPGGVPTREVLEYYRRRAEHGVGLIVTEGIGIDHPLAVDQADVPVLHGEAPLNMWKQVVEAVHAANGIIVPQLWHQGVMWNTGLQIDATGLRAARPSGIWGPPNGTISLDAAVREHAMTVTRPMTEEEIQDIIDSFAQSAANANALGFDGVAIHAAHGYLIDTFFWHETNRRTDRFGGDHRARATFGAEVVRAVRREIGESKPIILRFSQFKMQDYLARMAETPAELAELLGPLADAGVDLFDASQRYFDTPAFEGSALNLAGWAKRLTGKASMTVGGVGLGRPSGKATHLDDKQVATNNLERLRERFTRGEFDLVAVGRSLLNDPAWLRKAVAGEPFLPFDAKNLQLLT